MLRYYVFAYGFPYGASWEPISHTTEFYHADKDYLYQLAKLHREGILVKLYKWHNGRWYVWTRSGFVRLYNFNLNPSKGDRLIDADPEF